VDDDGLEPWERRPFRYAFDTVLGIWLGTIMVLSIVVLVLSALVKIRWE
jgi:threonine/homoserine/homoserine lactone efflux protein